MAKSIIFKSFPQYYIKERDGRKSNTVRIVTEEQDDFIQNTILTYIKIKDTTIERSFIRTLTDITRFEYKDLIIYIFSW